MKSSLPSSYRWLLPVLVLLATIIYVLTLLQPPLWVRIVAAVVVGVLALSVIATAELKRRRRERERR